MKKTSFGPLLIAIAAALWATDSIFRVSVIRAEISPIQLVLLEHLIGIAALIPWILFKHRKNWRSFSASQWLGLSCIGVVGSALASALFTASFQYVNPSVAILLQKTQPVFVIGMAIVFLKERPAMGFYLWAILALAAGVVLSFPDLDFSFIQRHDLDPHSRGTLYALSAALFWAVSTVIGKKLLQSIPSSVTTLWRFIFGAIALAMIQSTQGAVHLKLSPELTRAILYMGLVPGLLAMTLYYFGLQRTRAGIATLVELTFPVTAVILNAYFLNAPLSATQFVAGLILITAITQVAQHG